MGKLLLAELLVLFNLEEAMDWKPSIVLHDHFDGAHPLMSILKQLFEMSCKRYPFPGNILEQYQAVKKIFRDTKIDIVERFSNTTGVMQHTDTLNLAAETYVRMRAKSGFEYCELTIAPQYHTYRGLTVQEVIAAVIDGIKRGERAYPQMETNILFTVGREVDEDYAVSLVEAADKCDRDYVVGIGLVCDEAAHPPEKHMKMFSLARDMGFKTTCHAGEWVSGEPDLARDLWQLIKNIRTAIFLLGVDRVGHAIPLAFDRDLIKYVVDNNIGVEGCPASNLVSGLIPNTKYLHIDELLDAGVLYSLNPDDDLFLPDLNTTFVMCDAEYHFTDEQKTKLMMNPWVSRFGSRKPHFAETS